MSLFTRINRWIRWKLCGGSSPGEIALWESRQSPASDEEGTG